MDISPVPSPIEGEIVTQFWNYVKGAAFKFARFYHTHDVEDIEQDLYLLIVKICRRYVDYPRKHLENAIKLSINNSLADRWRKMKSSKHGIFGENDSWSESGAQFFSHKVNTVLDDGFYEREIPKYIDNCSPKQARLAKKSMCP